MDTKSRSYSHSILAKIIAFILVVASFTSMVFISLEAMGRIDEGFLNSHFDENYYLSKDYQNEITSALYDVKSLAVDYKNEEHIRSGALIDKEELERRKEELFNEVTDNYEYDSYEELRNKFSENNLVIIKKYSIENIRKQMGGIYKEYI